MTARSLHDLLADLDLHLSADPRGAQVAHLLEEYARGADDWRSYALFEATYYSRNLVRKSELYELIVLCWSPGQRSPIHDHASQRCWMAVLEGRVRESLFKVDAQGPSVRPGPVRSFDAGQVAYVVDDIGWHRIEPAGDAAAITLHLYSRPIRECRIFDEASASIATRRLSYHSVAGRLTAAPS